MFTVTEMAKVGWKSGVWGLVTQPVFVATCVNYLLVSVVRGACEDWGHLYLIQDKHHSHLTGTYHDGMVYIELYTVSLSGLSQNKLELFKLCCSQQVVTNWLWQNLRLCFLFHGNAQNEIEQWVSKLSHAHRSEIEVKSLNQM